MLISKRCIWSIFIAAFTSGSAVGEETNSSIDALQISESERTAAEVLWTDEEMRAAVAIDTELLEEGEIGEENAPDEAEIFGTDEDFFVPYFDRSMRGTPSRANVGLAPFKFGGRLFFQKPEGKRTCSAQFVGSERVLLTAAHCVRDPSGAYFTNFLFVRAYENGAGDRFKVDCVVTRSEWVATGKRRIEWDYAFIRTTRASGLGNLGLRTRLGATGWKEIGYPKNYEDGKYMQQVDGTLGNQSARAIQMLGNPMTGGSSGGAWLDGSIAIGLHSARRSGVPGKVWGPNFDSRTKELFSQAQRPGCN